MYAEALTVGSIACQVQTFPTGFPRMPWRLGDTMRAIGQGAHHGQVPHLLQQRAVIVAQEGSQRELARRHLDGGRVDVAHPQHRLVAVEHLRGPAGGAVNPPLFALHAPGRRGPSPQPSIEHSIQDADLNCSKPCSQYLHRYVHCHATVSAPGAVHRSGVQPLGGGSRAGEGTWTIWPSITPS